MPPRSNTPSKGSFGPPNDNATYRDLLLFEERLKTNAANLQRRKARYQLFLLHLLIVIAFLLWEVILPPQTSILSIPYRMLLQRLIPDANPNATMHPYIASGFLFVSVTTLALVFASGMYAEKIAYANKYVPHANRALRSLNMYLNVRKPPLRSKLYWNPISFFFPRPDEVSASRTASRSPSPSPRTRQRSASTTRPIHTIPPATNPRGELIFSSRVDKNFREAYERYRAAFERRREVKEYDELQKTWYAKLMFWKRAPVAIAPTAPPTPLRTTSSSHSSLRGRGSRSGTPPMGNSDDGGIVMRQRDRSGSGSPAPRRRRPVGERPPRRDRDSGSETDMRTAVLERSIDWDR